MINFHRMCTCGLPMMLRSFNVRPFSFSTFRKIPYFLFLILQLNKPFDSISYLQMFRLLSRRSCCESSMFLVILFHVTCSPFRRTELPNFKISNFEFHIFFYTNSTWRYAYLIFKKKQRIRVPKVLIVVDYYI